MRILGILEADLTQSSLGLRSHQGDVLAGVPLLRRTAERCLRATEVAGWVAVCERSEEEAVGRMLAGLAVEVVAVDGLRRPADSHLVRARKWAVHSWRGGLSSATWFDELVHVPGVHLAVARKADAVVFVNGAAALTDPAWTDTAVRHHRETAERVKLTFSQAAPGLVPPVFRTELLTDLLRAKATVGTLFRLNLDDPQFDLTSKDCNLVVPMQINTSPYRFSADSDGTAGFLGAVIEGLSPPHAATAEEAAAWAEANPSAAVGELPRELTVEITSETNLPGDAIRFPPANGARGRMSVETFSDLCRQLAGRDDALLNLAGCGEPLVHPEWPALLAAAREAGVWGVSVRTNALALDESAAERLLDCDVDVLDVLLDADTESTYRALKGEAAFGRVVENLRQFLAARAKCGHGHPILAVRCAKMPETMAEMEPFYLRWLTLGAVAILDGYNDFGGTRPYRGVVHMAPPGRRACRRIFSRLSVLANGSVTVCEQDTADKHAPGTLDRTPLGELWTGDVLTALRQAHIRGDYGTFPLCPTCRQWYGP